MKIIIAAMGYNRVIGANGRMPWWVPEEYQQFLDFIRGQSVVFGRKTYGYFSKDVPAKRVLLVSRQNLSYENAIVCPSVEAALQQAEQFPEDIYIAGGGEIYAQTLAIADKLYLSYIKGEYEGEVFFPEFDLSEWEVEEHREELRYEFFVYRRVSA